MSFARAQDELVGRSVGEFVLRERIGEGGFGAVYRASQPALDREAVVKVLHARLTTSPSATERFLREARLASKLDHPYAAHIYAFGAEPDGELWIAMELVRGTPLDQILRIQGPLPLERFVPLLDRICEVVQTAHEQGIVHRDLKPANVMVLARAGRLLPKLLDFGIAKGLADAGPGADDVARTDTLDVAAAAGLDPEALAQTHQASTPVTPSGAALTQRGAIMGSPPYMAPEQWVDAGQVDARTDLYALGVLAFECLTGKPPFTGTTMMQIAQAHARQKPPALGSRFPPALDKVFAKVLAKTPEDRYPDALAFAAAFRQASGVTAEAATVPGLDPEHRDAAVNGAPQPIAEAIAAIEAARNPHQARDAIAQVARTIARYLGLLAVACRSRVSGGDEPLAVTDALRTLYRRPLADREWLELACQLTKPWLARRDAYPVPELVDLCHGLGPGLGHGLSGQSALDLLDGMLALRDRELASEAALVELLEGELARLAQLLDALAFIREYSLAVTTAGGLAERWMGVRRMQRATIAVRGKGLAAGLPVLLDPDGVPVLALAPLFQVDAPAPGAPLELFLFEGRDARGAKLVALPGGFERHDEALWGWFRERLSESFDETSAAQTEERAPYRGLSAFSSHDGALFVGREKLVDAFLNRLKQQPLLVVVGRSGAGKSSFVHAGVLPALPASWRTVTVRPGQAPLAALVARLEHAGLGRADLRAAIEQDREALGAHLRSEATRGGPIVLVVDQLEELFTLCGDPAERRAFADALASAAHQPEDPVRVIFTLRDDFLVRTEQIPALRSRIGQSLQLLGVPVAEDLVRIVVEPARRAGYELEDERLAQDMVGEVADQPGALALISFTASKLWELRDRHFKQLTRAAYKALGGVGGALARHADITLDEMPSDERALAREAFRHLVTSQNTRAVLARGELRQLLGSSDPADRVIEKLVAARLLVASENESGAETIELVHEALLSAWPRLVEWRREDAEGARFREQLRAAAGQWQERGRTRGLLWRGDALAEYTLWRARHPGPLTDLEAAFATASEGDAARGRRNLRALVAAAFTTLVAVVVGLVVFNARIAGQRARAEGERARAESNADKLQTNLEHQLEDQGRRLVLAGEPLQALAYLAKAGELGARGPAHDFLVAEAARASEDHPLFVLRHAGAVQTAQWTPDGKLLVTASYDHTARVWDAATGALRHTLAHDSAVIRLAIAPDGKSLVTATVDGTLTLWDPATGVRLRTFDASGAIPCVSFSPDGSSLLAASAGVKLWDVATGALRVAMQGAGGRMTGCAFSHDGSRVLAGDRHGEIHEWDARTGRTIATWPSGQHDIRQLFVSPDGARLASTSNDGTVGDWELASARRVALFHHDAAVISASFSPDGLRIATASNDHTAKVWNAVSGALLFTLVGHAAGVNRAVFSPDGTHVITTSDDATIRLWDARDGRPIARWLGHRDLIIDLQFDAAGTRLATASDDGTSMVWPATSHEHTVWLAGHTGPVTSATFSPDARTVLTAGADGTARIWDARTGQPLAVLRGHDGAVEYATYSPDGHAVVTAGEDHTVRTWDARTGEQLHVFVGHTARVIQARWAPDGKSIVSASTDGTLRLWPAAGGAARWSVTAHGGNPLFSVTFSPDGARIATTGDDGTIRFWDAASGAPLARLADREDPAGIAFSPDGKRALSAVDHEAFKVWDTTTGQKLLDLVGHSGQGLDVAWSPDGQLLATAAMDGTTRIWDAATGDTLAVLAQGHQVRAIGFAGDGALLVTAADDGTVAIRELPRRALAAGQLATLVRCRVPFRIEQDRLVPVVLDPSRCPSP